MPNHGYCKNCWWWEEIPTIATVWQEVERKGQCFMHTHGGHNEYTEENSYCPDYFNRKKGNKEQTLDEWSLKQNIK